MCPLFKVQPMNEKDSILTVIAHIAVQHKNSRLDATHVIIDEQNAASVLLSRPC
jgi:phenylpyruvate tautomerase PptA (4-oxalocrotonate tautomerase family)